MSRANDAWMGRALLAGLMAGMVLLAGCGQQAPKRKLVVLCGSSFAPPGRELVEKFAAKTGVKVEISLAGSEDFLPQVKLGAVGDVLITHDPFLDYVKDAGRLADAVQVANLAPVLAVAKGNPKAVKRVEDLARPGLRVGLTDPKYSTCGEMVYNLLEKKGLKEQVLANVGNRLTKGHGTLGTWLKADAVDAVIMWNGVAHTMGESVEVVPTADAYEPQVRVHVMGLNYGKQPELVRQFVEFARAEGAKVFGAHGYGR